MALEIDLTQGAGSSGGRVSNDAFADSIAAELFGAGSDADALPAEDDGASARGRPAPRSRTRPEPATEPGPREREREAEPEDDDDELAPGELPEGEPGEDGDGDPETDAEQERVREAEHVRGSQDDPFTVKDLPADKYIELTIDGEKRTVSLAELGKGYIREETFHQRVGKVQQQAQEAAEGAKKVQELRGKLREELSTLLHDPEQLYEFFTQTEEREQVLEQVAMKYAKLLRQFREFPEEKLKFQRARDVARLDAERAHWQRQREEAERAEQEKLQTERAMKILKPGWEEGLRKAGFPEPTRELYDEVIVRCEQRARQGHDITQADVAEFTYRAAKLLELAPRGRKRPPPAPAAAPREDSRAARAQRRDRFANMTRQERLRDPEYFLQGLGRRELGGY